jgi:hypothetical protein
VATTAEGITRSEPRRMAAFGMTIDAEIALPGTRRPRGSEGAADLRVSGCPWGELASLVEQPRRMLYLHQYEDCGFAVLEGVSGDVLFCYGRRALYHLSASGDLLRCAGSDAGTSWQRVFLDTVLWMTSLFKGHELLHASAVRTASGVVALIGQTGVGKSTLACELIRRGCSLFADDILAVESDGSRIIAWPGPPLMVVPASQDLPSLGAALIDRIGDEQWVRLPGDNGTCAPLRAMILLRRGVDQTTCRTISATSFEVLPHLLTSSAFPESRRRAHFEIAGELAARTEVIELSWPALDDPANAIVPILERLGIPFSEHGPDGR